MDLFRLDGRTAIVTGAAGGLGRGIALALGERGAKIAVCDLKEEALSETMAALKERGIPAMALACDVSDPSSFDEVMRRTEETIGFADILVNNAGITRMQDFFAVGVGDFKSIYEINVFGLFRCTQMFAEALREKKRGGHVVNIASNGAKKTYADQVHFMLSPSLTVGENIVLGCKPSKSPIWDKRKLQKRLEETLADMDFDVPLDAVVRDLSVGMMQRVEIVKTLYRGAKLIILDEPTAVLTPQETEELFVSIRKLKERGHTVIFISHKLKEVMAISDRITVLRAGKTVGTVNKNDVTPEELAQMMIGRQLAGMEREQIALGEPVLKVKDLTVIGDRNKAEVNGLSFELRRGEILGIAGVEGNGQTELSECILGIRRAMQGSVEICGTDVTKASVNARIEKGLAFIPQERMTEGLALGCSITDNIMINRRDQEPILRRGIIRWDKAKALAEDLIGQYKVKASGADELCQNLSGGNMQKVIVARELSVSPQLVIACQPTRGVDIGASEYIHSMLLNTRDEGNAVLLISADLDEVMKLSDRILVMFEGEKTGEMTGAEADEKKIGRLMFGKEKEEAV